MTSHRRVLGLEQWGRAEQIKREMAETGGILFLLTTLRDPYFPSSLALSSLSSLHRTLRLPMLFRHVDSNQKKALEELYELLQLDTSRLHAVMVHLRNEIDAGLEDDRLVDLNMIPTFVTGKQSELIPVKTADGLYAGGL